MITCHAFKICTAWHYSLQMWIHATATSACAAASRVTRLMLLAKAGKGNRRKHATCSQRARATLPSRGEWQQQATAECDPSALFQLVVLIEWCIVATQFRNLLIPCFPYSCFNQTLAAELSGVQSRGSERVRVLEVADFRSPSCGAGMRKLSSSLQHIFQVPPRPPPRAATAWECVSSGPTQNLDQGVWLQAGGIRKPREPPAEPQSRLLGCSAARLGQGRALSLLDLALQWLRQLCRRHTWQVCKSAKSARRGAPMWHPFPGCQVC